MLSAKAQVINEIITYALAEMAKTTPDNVKRIMDIDSAKAVVSLCWKAEISMRLAIEIQRKIARLPHPKVLLAKGGEDYPLSKADIQWQLEFFDLA